MQRLQVARSCPGGCRLDTAAVLIRSVVKKPGMKASISRDARVQISLRWPAALSAGAASVRATVKWSRSRTAMV